jgi:hypothetical protein
MLFHIRRQGFKPLTQSESRLQLTGKLAEFGRFQRTFALSVEN